MPTLCQLCLRHTTAGTNRPRSFTIQYGGRCTSFEPAHSILFFFFVLLLETFFFFFFFFFFYFYPEGWERRRRRKRGRKARKREACLIEFSSCSLPNSVCFMWQEDRSCSRGGSMALHLDERARPKTRETRETDRQRESRIYIVLPLIFWRPGRTSIDPD